MKAGMVVLACAAAVVGCGDPTVDLKPDSAGHSAAATHFAVGEYDVAGTFTTVWYRGEFDSDGHPMSHPNSGSATGTLTIADTMVLSNGRYWFRDVRLTATLCFGSCDTETWATTSGASAGTDSSINITLSRPLPTYPAYSHDLAFEGRFANGSVTGDLVRFYGTTMYKGTFVLTRKR